MPNARAWFNLTELAALALPGLPADRRRLDERAESEGWAQRIGPDGTPLARQRQGRGGGIEYHVELLPAAARIELIRRGAIATGPSAANDGAQPALRSSESGWHWLEQQSEKVRAEALKRAEILTAVETFEGAGLTRSDAIAAACVTHKVSPATIWGWLGLIKGIAREDWPVALAPRRTGGGKRAEIDPRAWDYIRADWLRDSKPSFASCFRRLKRYAAAENIELPHKVTLRRRLVRDLDRRVVVATREGKEALRRMLPPQSRSVADLHALALITMDGHKFDVWVRWPGIDKPIRPVMVAIQDVFSRKILGWRIGVTESAHLTRLALADVMRDYGIPKACVMDNGRGFASKWVTGGSKTRFRFKIRDDEPLGLLTLLGVNIHWTLPYRGQSKPIERAFRDMCDDIARHPACDGAWSGNRPDAKPDSYQSKAVDHHTFIALVKDEIAAHNARPGRRAQGSAGRSFDQAFADSYVHAPVGRATREQLRLALLAGEQVGTHRESGAITLFGNRYWAQELMQIAGAKVIVRFDPDDLTLPVHVYDRAGRFLVSAPLIEQTGFLDVDAARDRARLEAEHRKTTRRLTDLERRLSPSEAAARLPAFGPVDDLPDAAIIRPVRVRGQTAAAMAIAAPVPEASANDAPATSHDQFLDRFSQLRLVDE